jgi:hypothetical protein
MRLVKSVGGRMPWDTILAPHGEPRVNTRTRTAQEGRDQERAPNVVSSFPGAGAIAPIGDMISTWYVTPPAPGAAGTVPPPSGA